MSRKERRAARAAVRTKPITAIDEPRRREGLALRVQMLRDNAIPLLDLAREMSGLGAAAGEFMGIVVDVREAEGVRWAKALGMTEEAIRETVGDTSRAPTAGFIAERGATIQNLAQVYPKISEVAERVPVNGFGVVALKEGAASFISLPVDATEGTFDFEALLVSRIDNALTPEQTDN